MTDLNITFLGTGTSQGVPVIACECEVCLSKDIRDKRLRTSVMISVGKRNLVIDTGPDFREQMLREQVKNLDAVIFTHEHKDHIAGLDDIRAFNYRSQSPMHVYATERVFTGLQREFHYVFDGTNYPGIPEVTMHFFDQEPLDFWGETLIPIDVLHHRLPVKAFRIRNFTYITDANYIPPESFEKIQGTEILVLNALRTEPHISHFNLEEALEVIKKIGPEKAYLTHISHLLGTHEQVSEKLPSNVELAYDGLRLTIS